MSIEVTQATRDQASIIAQMQIDLCAETETFRLVPEVVSRGVKRVFDQPEIGQYWLATLDDKVVGCCLTLSEWSDWRARNVLWLHSVYVEPEHRRRGVFRAMYDHLREHVKSNPDLAGIRLYVEKFNEKAMATYDDVGMSREHYHLYEWMKDH